MDGDVLRVGAASEHATDLDWKSQAELPVDEAQDNVESDDEEFKYPADDTQEVDNDDLHESDEEFSYPVDESEAHSVPANLDQETTQIQEIQAVIAHTPPLAPESPAPSQRVMQITPAQLEALYAAGLDGNMAILRELVDGAVARDLEPFTFVNSASPRTGLTVVHAAASRGRLSALRWLIEDCGGMPDLEDKEGETALHKAALNGHLSVIIYLVQKGAEVNARDADGWTPLHNASSKGYLDIVKWLCETGGASENIDDDRGVDARSKGGWTPLMNASSKGHLPVVRYLLSKQNANPLVRNDWGETAYDVAAAVFEIWICEVLRCAEADRWRGTTAPYDPLAVHTTVPIVLYEHQKLDMRLKTLAVNSGRPIFSVSGLGRKGRRAPFELLLPKANEETGKKEVPAWRSDVQLPLLEQPFELPIPCGGKERAAHEGAERSHFWLSDWTVDLTYPRVDVDEGWQYARSFSDPEDQWSAGPPPPLERLLSGSGAVTMGLSGQSARSESSSSSRPVSNHAWVRRRRWVRVMRRRLDIPPLPFLGTDGGMYDLSTRGSLVPHISDVLSDGVPSEGQELGAMPTTFLSTSQDYVARSRYLAGTPAMDIQTNGAPQSAIETRRAIAKLERAVMELRTGMLGDQETERRTQAEVLLNAYSRELERRRLAAGAAGISLSSHPEEEELDNDSDDESFHYPGSSPSNRTHMRSPSAGSQRSQAADYFNHPTITRSETDLTPHLSQAPEFRVPTHEAPQKVALPRINTPTPHSLHAEWVRDDQVTECLVCKRRFTFLFRKHCRRCGKIFCDRCSSYRTILDPAEVVHDPAIPEPSLSLATQHRVCQQCFDESSVNSSVPARFQGASSSLQRLVVAEDRLAIPSHLRRSESSSQISDLADCPVCGKNLSEIVSPFDQEEHVKTCLEGGSGAVQQPPRYLVYKLLGESALVGTECVICLEEFAKGTMVARLSCLCSFHNTCLSAWLMRGRSCPVHARDN